MKKLGMFLLILLLCISLSGCSELAKLVSDMNSEDNPLSGKNTDERKNIQNMILWLWNRLIKKMISENLKTKME